MGWSKKVKLRNLLKIIPFLSTFFFIFLIYTSNQKTSTNLRILIWITPSLSLGSYLAISTGAGFILSYIITTRLSSIVKHKSSNSIRYKNDIANEDVTENTFNNLNYFREKTLIERNINDPSPTMDAQFRVIGKTERYINNNIADDNVKYENSYDSEESYIENKEEDESINDGKEFTTDWNDDSFRSW